MITKSTLIAAAMVALAACGSPNRDFSAPAAPPPVEMAMKQSAQDYDMAAEESAGGEQPAAQQYIAYTHSIGMRLPVSSIEPTMQGHIAACNAAGPSVCIITNSWLTAYAEDSVGASLNLRATPAWIETFLSGVEAEAEAAKGDVTNRQTTAEDLTVSIIDTGARLKAQKTLQERLQALLAERPGELGDLLETERELARVNGEIDSLTSSLATLRQRVDMSQLAVNYETKLNPVSQGALQPLGEAFGNFFYNLASAIAAVVTAFAVGLPWLLLIGALLWIWLRLIWPRIRRKKPNA
ncbi:putative lipoprotein [Hyphomonas neptunium ATCC 15444]|uniref:Putative lipoprotein n=2 Tax=Hyphomonas TaxID=85 RepID=Q0C615_HYPNA|nr:MULTISPECIES: DUF4349 domain-containing protein [Hyphomonas]ABI76973.1 putative lipoprotein [Hyphomonas neptunium ATCC 15444]KCZ94907.1 putative lipoprotein [Hyphomonas hirschiana VP5]